MSAYYICSPIWSGDIDRCKNLPYYHQEAIGIRDPPGTSPIFKPISRFLGWTNIKTIRKYLEIYGHFLKNIQYILHYILTFLPPGGLILKGWRGPPPKNCLTRSPYIYILVCFASQVSQLKSFGVSYITYSWHLMMLYLPYYHPEAIGPPWHIFNVSTSNGRAYIVSRHDQDSAREALEHMMLL